MQILESTNFQFYAIEVLTYFSQDLAFCLGGNILRWLPVILYTKYFVFLYPKILHLFVFQDIPRYFEIVDVFYLLSKLILYGLLPTKFFKLIEDRNTTNAKKIIKH